MLTVCPRSNEVVYSCIGSRKKIIIVIGIRYIVHNIKTLGLYNEILSPFAIDVIPLTA